MNRNARLPALVAALINLIAVFCGGCGARNRVAIVTPAIGTVERGIASWYGPGYHGRATASGEIFDTNILTAAHRRYAFGTWVRVQNLDNRLSTEVRINDRGPFVRGRIIDLSKSAALKIDMVRTGTARVKVTVIRPPRNSN